LKRQSVIFATKLSLIALVSLEIGENEFFKNIRKLFVLNAKPQVSLTAPNGNYFEQV